MRIKKADIILALVIIIIGLVGTFYLTFSIDNDMKNGQVIIHVNEEYYGSYPLDKDRVITVKEGDHINKITIKDGYAQMSFSNCPNHDCMEQGKIKDSSKAIICLPNKVVVEVVSQDSEYKAISK